MIMKFVNLAVGATLATAATAFAADYTGPGATMVNSMLQGIEQSENLRCFDSRSDRTWAFSHNVERDISCRNSAGSEVVRAVVHFSDNFATHGDGVQVFQKIEFHTNSCRDCTTHYPVGN